MTDTSTEKIISQTHQIITGEKGHLSLTNMASFGRYRMIMLSLIFRSNLGPLGHRGNSKH